MRKCPNCHKNIPVGARRCVHCRAILSEFEGGENGPSTQLGVFGNRDSEAVRGNTTAFGLPRSLSPLESNSVRGSATYNDEGPHQTMLGLGTVSSQPSPRQRDVDDTDRLAAGNHTIAGMPGIKLDLNSGGNRRPGGESIMGASSSRMNRATPVSQEPVPRSVAKNIAPSTKPVINSGLKIENDDPFAGLPGVSPAPVPSSLIDEEFVDLTAKLFGDDFAAGANDIEDDGWDFDVPVDDPVVKASPEPLSISGAGSKLAKALSEAPTKSEHDSPDVLEQLLSASSIQAQTLKKEEKSESKPAEAPKAEEPSKVETPVAKEPASVAATEPVDEKPAPVAEQSPVAATEPEKRASIMGMAVAVVAAIASLAWLAFLPEGFSASQYPLLLVASGVAVLVDVASLAISKKVSNLLLAGAFCVAMAVIFVMVVVTGIPKDAATVNMARMAGAILQAVCAVIYFIRKA